MWIDVTVNDKRLGPKIVHTELTILKNKMTKIQYPGKRIININKNNRNKIRNVVNWKKKYC